MRVQVQDRVDDHTIICRISWDRPSSTTSARFIVRIPATLAEFSAEHDAEIVPASLRKSALLRARDAADAFSTAVSESLDA
jgi:DNA gyrase inhibitor GyrI